jgi:hypothetical protein
MPIILATQEAEIRRIVVRSQPQQRVCKRLSQKYPSQKRAGGMAQGGGLKFKPQYYKKKKKKKKKSGSLISWGMPSQTEVLTRLH